jgi:hypothetical protein
MPGASTGGRTNATSLAPDSSPDAVWDRPKVRNSTPHLRSKAPETGQQRGSHLTSGGDAEPDGERSGGLVADRRHRLIKPAKRLQRAGQEGSARRRRVHTRLVRSRRAAHLDALTSGVPLNVDLDTTLTVVARDLCRLLAPKLDRYEKATRRSDATSPASTSNDGGCSSPGTPGF